MTSSDHNSNPETNMSDLYYDLDAAIYAITGNSTFTAEGLRSTDHLSKVAVMRVERLRERRDALKGGA